MVTNNFIPMGFGCCHCRYCRHVFKDNHGRYKKYHSHWQRLRPYQYRKIIKKLRQHKHEEELPNRLFNVMRYTD